MNIAIIGGGNNGSVLATKFSQQHNVKLYISNRNGEINKYLKNMQCLNQETQITTTAKISLITDSMEEALKDAEYIFITYPQFLFEDLSKIMIPLLKNQNLVFVPGSGGAEFWFRDCLKNGCTISGLQRVHAVTRIIEKGKLVRESGVRSSLKVASIPQRFVNEASKVVSNLYNLPVESLPNYINLTLINSNSILHTSRLYSLFRDYKNGDTYQTIPLFYEQWDMDSSKLLIDMDAELDVILKKLFENGVNTSGIIPILQHYESTNAVELTNKITSIQGFKGLTTPSVETNKGLIPDFDSRYFTSDFPFGLDLILAVAEIVGVECKHMKEVSNWYHNITGDIKRFNLHEFNINNISDLVGFYN